MYKRYYQQKDKKSAKPLPTIMEENYIVHALNEIKVTDDELVNPPGNNSKVTNNTPVNKKRYSGVIISKGIKHVMNLLDGLQVVYSTEVHFGASCHHWKPLPFDIMVVIKDRIGLIEYDGQQHFEYGHNSFTKTKEDLNNQQIRDMIKTLFAKKHGISLLRISHDTDTKDIERYILNFLGHLNCDKSKDPIYIFSNLELYQEHQRVCMSSP